MLIIVTTSEGNHKEHEEHKDFSVFAYTSFVTFVHFVVKAYLSKMDFLWVKAGQGLGGGLKSG
jgi:hypothetical protein